MITMNRLMKGDKVIGYRFDIPELGKSYDMFEYAAKGFYNAVGRKYFQKGKTINMHSNGTYCYSDDEKNVVECTEWYNLVGEYTKTLLGSGYVYGKRVNTSEVDRYMRYPETNKLVERVKRTMKSTYGNAMCVVEYDKYDCRLKFVYYFKRFTDILLFTQEYMRCTNETNLKLDVRFYGKNGYVKATSVPIDTTDIYFAHAYDCLYHAGNDIGKGVGYTFSDIVPDDLVDVHIDVVSRNAILLEGELNGDEIVFSEVVECDIPGYEDKESYDEDDDLMDVKVDMALEGISSKY